MSEGRGLGGLGEKDEGVKEKTPSQTDNSMGLPEGSGVEGGRRGQRGNKW